MSTLFLLDCFFLIFIHSCNNRALPSLEHPRGHQRATACAHIVGKAQGILPHVIILLHELQREAAATCLRHHVRVASCQKKISCRGILIVIIIICLYRLCGSWAGDAYAGSGCPGSCAAQVMDPANYQRTHSLTFLRRHLSS